MSQQRGRVTGGAGQFDGSLHTLADQINHALTFVPRWARIESADDVGVLALTLGRLCLFTIDETQPTAEKRMVDHLCKIIDSSVDAVQRCAEDEELLIQAFAQLRTQVKALEPVVDDLIAALAALSGRPVSRFDLLIDARAAADGSEKRAGSRALESTFSINPAGYYETRFNMVGMAGKVGRSAGAHGKSNDDTMVTDDQQVDVLGNDELWKAERAEKQSADRYRGYAMTICGIAVVSAAILLLLAPAVVAGRGLVFCSTIWISLASLSTYCAYQSKEHRNEQYRKEMVRHHMAPGGFFADLPDGDRADAKKWAFREHYKVLVRPSSPRLTDSPMGVSYVFHVVAMVLQRKNGRSADKPKKDAK